MKKLSIGLTLLFIFTIAFSATMTFTENAVATPCNCCIEQCPFHPNLTHIEGHLVGSKCTVEPCGLCSSVHNTCPE